MYKKPILTARRVTQWLDALIAQGHTESSVVAWAGDSMRCPLAHTALHQGFSHPVVAVVSTTYRMPTTTFMRTPAWARRFITRVDSIARVDDSYTAPRPLSIGVIRQLLVLA